MGFKVLCEVSGMQETFLSKLEGGKLFGISCSEANPHREPGKEHYAGQALAQLTTFSDDLGDPCRNGTSRYEAGIGNSTITTSHPGAYFYMLVKCRFCCNARTRNEYQER